MTIEPDRLVSGRDPGEEVALDRALRPTTLAGYIGQEVVKEQMAVFIEAARRRREPLDHTLIFGPPGLGKTTLAHIIANEMSGALKSTSGPVLEKAGDLAALLTNLDAGDVLFIDEIHRLSPVVEEILYPAMEDFQIDIVIGEGPAARSIKLDVPPFTLVGATTRAGLLDVAAARSFRHRAATRVLQRRRADPDCDALGGQAAACVSNMTAPSKLRVARAARRASSIDCCGACATSPKCEGDGRVTAKIANQALDMLNVDAEGFDTMDRRLLLTILEKFGGGPVGIDSLAAAISEERDTIEDVLEPFLIQQGFIMRTPRGRIVTEKAYHHFGLAAADAAWRRHGAGESRHRSALEVRGRKLDRTVVHLFAGAQCQRARADRAVAAGVRIAHVVGDDFSAHVRAEARAEIASTHSKSISGPASICASSTMNSSARLTISAVWRRCSSRASRSTAACPSRTPIRKP